MKATYKEIKHLIDYTNKENKVFEGANSQPYVDELGYFSPMSANWAYRVGIAEGTDEQLYLVVTVYGEVKGYRKLHFTQKGF